MYIFYPENLVQRPRCIRKLLLVMKLTTLLLVTVIVQVSASAFAQKITLAEKNASLVNVFDKIRLQSGYDFLWTTSMLKDANPVTINVREMDLDAVLKLIFAEQPLEYSIVKKSVVVSMRQPSFIDRIVKYVTDVKITGRVTDDQGAPLIGATISIKGDKPVVSDAAGEFQLSGGEGTVLIISFIGYDNVEHKITKAEAKSIASGHPLLITLKKADLKLNEVRISTGYTSKKVGELTGAVQRVSGDELRRSVTTSDPVAMLKGKFAGLYIADQNGGDPTSSGAQIFVRGQSSLAGVGLDQYNEPVVPALNYGPLLVLDGVIMPNQNLKDLVTPQEIQDVVLLKDAAATAIYGSRAAGGVLVVTTKKGRSGAAPRINAEIKYGFNQPNEGTLHYLSGQQLYDLQKVYYTQDYSINKNSLVGTYPDLQAYLDNQLPTQADVNNSFDWYKYVYIPTHTKEITASISGGNDNSRYYVGAGYYNEQSTGINNGLIRKSFRMNLDNRLSSRLTSSISINGILNDGKRDEGFTAGIIYMTMPWANPYNADGSLRPYLTYKENGSTNQTNNPLYDSQFDFNKLQSQLFFGSAKLDFKIFDWLHLVTTNSGNLNYSKNVDYLDPRAYMSYAYDYSSKGTLATTNNNLTSYLTSNQLIFNKRFGNHSISALAAMEFGKTTADNTYISVNHVRPGYPVISLANDIGGQYDFTAYGSPTTKAGNINGGTDVKGQYSLFGEVGYTYKDKISLSGSVRSDASSSFGRDRRYGTFYSGGAAWVVSNENFLKEQHVVSNLKLRANYGTSGSQLGDSFLTQTLYGISSNQAGDPTATISVLGNPDLRWEVTKTLSGGVDFGLFNRVNATIDIYNRRSDDLLQKVTLPYLAGFAGQWQNVASVNNKGIEIQINSENIKHEKFNWSTSFNFTYNKNQIMSVANDSLKQGFYTVDNFYLYKGDDINELKAIKYAGVDPQTGKPKFEKLIFNSKGERTGVEYVNSVDEVGAATDNRQRQDMGSFQPRFYGGITNNFSYGPFSLNVLITYALKYVMIDGLAQQNQGGSITSYQQIAFRKNDVIWTTPGQTNATVPMLYYNSNTYYRGSSKYVHDASNIALRSVRLSYDLPASLMKKLNLNNCSIYASGDNLYTRYSKEIVALNSEGPAVGQAQDFGGSAGTLGIPRRYILGVQLTF